MGSHDIQVFAVVAMGLSRPGSEEPATAVPLGTHTQGYAAHGTAASTPPLTAAWVRVGSGTSQLLVVGDETVTSLEIGIGTEQIEVSGHVAVLDLPPRKAWVTTGEPEESTRPRYAVVSRTAEDGRFRWTTWTFAPASSCAVCPEAAADQTREIGLR